MRPVRTHHALIFPLAEEAIKSVKDLGESAVHAKYVELVCITLSAFRHFISISLQFAELKKVERDHSREKQKLVKDKDAGLSNARKRGTVLLYMGSR